MELSKSAIPLSVLSASFAFFGFCFYYGTKKINNAQLKDIGVRVALFLVSYGLMLNTISLGAVFYSITGRGLFATLIINGFVTFITNILAVYTSFYIFFPKKSQALPMIGAFALNATFIIGCLYYQPVPFLNEAGYLDWGFNFPLSLNLFYLLFIDIGAMIYIFWRLYFLSKFKMVKYLSLAFVFVSIIGLINVFVRFIVPFLGNSLGALALADKLIGLTGATIIVLFVFIPYVYSLYLRRK